MSPPSQAIEEGFILDVLKTYTSYKVAFSLAHHGKDGVKTFDSKEVDKSEAMKGIMGWVRLHEYNIAQRVQVVVEHYRKHVAGLLGGQAKAMVVTGSRKEAVRWQKATRKYIADHGYKIETLVAFSGEVIDLDSGPDPFTEHSKELNPKLGGQDIRTAFKGTAVNADRSHSTGCGWNGRSSRRRFQRPTGSVSQASMPIASKQPLNLQAPPCHYGIG